MKIIEYCQKATQDELIDLFNTLSKALVKQYKIKQKSSNAELTIKFANKKQHDSFYAKAFNDNRIYYQILEDIKIVIKNII